MDLNSTPERRGMKKIMKLEAAAKLLYIRAQERRAETIQKLGAEI